MTMHSPALTEQLAWERYRVAALIHNTEHTPRTWQARQIAYSAWAAAFLGDVEAA